MIDALLQILWAWVGSLGFLLIFNQRSLRLLIPGSLCGAFSWAVYLLCDMVFNMGIFLCSLWAAVFLALYAELMARVIKAPTTVFIGPGIIPLVPGSLLYYTMTHILQRSWRDALDYGLRTLSCALGIAAGIALVSALGYMYRKIKNKS